MASGGGRGLGLGENHPFGFVNRKSRRTSNLYSLVVRFSIHNMLSMFFVCQTLVTRNEKEHPVAEHVLQYLRDIWNESIEAKSLVHVYH